MNDATDMTCDSAPADAPPPTRWWRARWVRRVGVGLALTMLVPLITVTVVALIAVYGFPLQRNTLAIGNQPLRIVDRHGELIAELPADGPTGPASAHWTKLGDIPPIAIAAVIQSEDQNFWSHHGVDPAGIARAAYLNLRSQRAAYGGSTLTQQLARLLLSQGQRRSLWTKSKEALMALRLEHGFDKRTILENWFGRAYFGNGAYGYGDAAMAYFGRPATALTTGEAVLLAVLPRSPSGYDLTKHLDRAIARRDYVLHMLVQRGVLSPADAAAAQAQIMTLATPAPLTQALHFARWVAHELPANIRRRGGTVHTTLDLGLQRILEARMADHVAELRGRNLQQAAAVVLESSTGSVLAMVGTGHLDGPGNAINMALRRRHPGSALKPFVYAAAIERGESPVSIAWDVRDTDANYFAPTGGAEHGPTRYRQALASSFNFAAIDVIGDVGIGTVMTLLRRAGVTTDQADGSDHDYGLRLALGSAKVRLLDLASGYGFLVNQGAVIAPHAITRVEVTSPRRNDATGAAPHGSAGTWAPPRNPTTQLVSPATAWLTMDMLADPEARRPGFGQELPFDLPFRVAAKTGTARGFADTWAVAATREVTVAAWAGSIDGSPMRGVVGMEGAAPIVRDALFAIATRRTLTLPPRPATIVD
ncbi:MAG: transglycosylase domain-containing protein, partial [Kofleriaceae bacterium]|nr:transglycosylase domain-containing protein [Kofleriaceae bacterium]